MTPLRPSRSLPVKIPASAKFPISAELEVRRILVRNQCAVAGIQIKPLFSAQCERDDDYWFL